MLALQGTRTAGLQKTAPRKSMKQTNGNNETIKPGYSHSSLQSFLSYLQVTVLARSSPMRPSNTNRNECHARESFWQSKPLPALPSPTDVIDRTSTNAAMKVHLFSCFILNIIVKLIAKLGARDHSAASAQRR